MSAFGVLSGLVAYAISGVGVADRDRTAPVLAGTRSALTQANTLYGPTGLISVPTAYTAQPNQAAVSASFADGLRVPAFNYGIARYVEVGGAWFDRDGGLDKFVINAKATVVPQNFGNFELGIGVIDIADTVNQSVYVVGSMDLTPPTWDPTGQVGNPIAFKIHAGFGTGIYRDRLIGGADLLFPNQFSFVTEYDARNLNFALRYVHSDALRLQFGLQNKKPYFGMTSLVSF